MKLINDNLGTVYIDIDETITSDLGETFIAGSIEFIKEFSETINIILWSGGGGDYVMEVALKAGILNNVCACLPKPNMYIDDLNITNWASFRLPHWGKLTEIFKNLNGNFVDDSDVLNGRVNIGR